MDIHLSLDVHDQEMKAPIFANASSGETYDMAVHMDMALAVGGPRPQDRG